MSTKPAEPAEIVSEKLVVSRGNLPSLAPTNLTEAIAFSKLIASSDLAPRDFKGKPGNVLIAIQMGYEVGLKPMQALQNVAIINGRPSLWGDAALAVVMSHPDFEDIIETTEGTLATCTVKRRGRSPVVRRFSDTDAQAAGLLAKDGPWKTYRARMRAMRARGFALRDSFPDALRGMILAEEAMDLPPERLQREHGVIDANVLNTLTESAERNRGHDNEGMERPVEQPKPESASAKRTTRGVVTVTKIDPRMKNPTPAQVAKAKADKKAAPEPRPYFVLTCSGSEQNVHEIASWDTKHHEHILRSQNKSCDFTIAANDKGDRIFYNLEHIHRIGDVRFENDVPVNLDAEPAEQGELQQPSGAELFDK